MNRDFNMQIGLICLSVDEFSFTIIINMNVFRLQRK